MAAYLTVDEYKLRSLLPSEWMTELDALVSGFTAAQLEASSRLDLDARLRKRYAVPFETPVPEAVKIWLARIVDVAVLHRRGVNPNDPQVEFYVGLRERTLAEIKEAADSNEGLFDLPLRNDTTNSGIIGGTRVYSEASPYVWASSQGARGRDEDSSGGGSFT